MIYLDIPMMILGQNPDPAIQPAPVPVGDPAAQTKPEPTAIIPKTIVLADDEIVYKRKDLESIRREAETSRKKVKEMEETQAKAVEDKKLSEMSEIDRLKAQTKTLEEQINTEKQARELALKRAKLINIAAILNVAIPEFAVNQIDSETLKSLDLSNEDGFNLEIQKVINLAENAGMPITRKTNTTVIQPPGPDVGPTNPGNPNYPRPILTTDQQIAQLHNDYVKAVAEGRIAERQSIEQKIRKLEDQMGGIRKSPE